MTETKANNEHNEGQLNHSESTVATNTSQSTMQPENSSFAPNGVSPTPKDASTTKINLRQRLKHFTFAWFLCTMSTGGLSIALAETPHKFRGLHTIGLIIFFLTLLLFTIFSICMSTRLVLHPHHFLAIFTHPLESWFIGSFWLSISVIIGGIQLYGITYGPAYSWLIDAVYVLYWLYASFSFSSCIFQYYILIAQSKLRPVPFSPSMFLAGYSAMLTGTIASIIAGQQTPSRAVLVILSGLAFQGFGWLISSICLVYFVRLLLDKGLPPPQLRPALFIPVGSVAYTIVALIGQANVIPDYGYFAKHPTAREILQIMALFVGVFMWLFALFIFAIAVLANVGVVGKMPFSLTWWAFIFPNVGFMLSTRILGQQLDSPPILWIASVMTVLLVGIWIVSAAGCLRAVWTCRIAWPGKDEDKDL